MCASTSARSSTFSSPAARWTSTSASLRWRRPSSASSPACTPRRTATRTGSPARLPAFCMALAMLVVGVTGFCIKPLRDSGVITIPELFEKRFGPRIRWACRRGHRAGRPAQHGRVPAHRRRVPRDWSAGLDVRVPRNHDDVLLVGVAVYTILGGMLSVLVTDFLQFVVMSVGLDRRHDLDPDERRLGQPGRRQSRRITAPAASIRSSTRHGLGLRALQRLAEHGGRADLADHDRARAGGQGHATGRKIYTRTSFFFVCRFLIPGIWGIAALADVGASAGYAATRCRDT